MMLGVHLHKVKKTKKNTAPRSPRFAVYCAICETEWQACRKELTLIDWIKGIFAFRCWKCETVHHVVRVGQDLYEQAES